MNTIACIHGDNNKSVTYIDEGYECYGQQHIFFIGIGASVFIVFFTITMLCRTFVFSLRISPSEPTARLDYVAFPFFHLLRTLLCSGILLFDVVFSN